MRIGVLSTNGLLAVIALLLALNFGAFLVGERSPEQAIPAAQFLASPAQGQIIARDGRIYTASEDGRTLVVWRRNVHVWEGEVFHAKD